MRLAEAVVELSKVAGLERGAERESAGPCLGCLSVGSARASRNGRSHPASLPRRARSSLMPSHTPNKSHHKISIQTQTWRVVHSSVLHPRPAQLCKFCGLSSSGPGVRSNKQCDLLVAARWARRWARRLGASGSEPRPGARPRFASTQLEPELASTDHNNMARLSSNPNSLEVALSCITRLC